MSEQDGQAQQDQILETILAASATSGRMIWPFDKAFNFAAGRKDLYFSANNENIEFEEGQLIADHEGANYIKPIPEGESHLIEVSVLRPDLTEEDLNSPHMSQERKNFESKLPVVLRSNAESKPIAEITAKEARDAGYADVNSFRITMAMQSDKAGEFLPTIKEAMGPIVQEYLQKVASDGIMMPNPNGQGMVRGQVDQSFLQAVATDLPELGIQAMTTGIDPAQLTTPIHQQFVATLMSRLSRSVDPATIPGTVSVYRMRLATPEEYHNYHPDQPSIEQANKTVANSLRYFISRLKHAVFPLDKKVRNRFEDKYGVDKLDGTGLNNMLDKIEEKANEICPPGADKEVSPREELEARIKEAKATGAINDVQHFELHSKLMGSGGDHAITAIGEQLDNMLSEGKGQSVA